MLIIWINFLRFVDLAFFSTIYLTHQRVLKCENPLHIQNEDFHPFLSLQKKKWRLELFCLYLWWWLSQFKVKLEKSVMTAALMIVGVLLFSASRSVLSRGVAMTNRLPPPPPSLHRPRPQHRRSVSQTTCYDYLCWSDYFTRIYQF